jgi:hypothetical protein
VRELAMACFLLMADSMIDELIHRVSFLGCLELDFPPRPDSCAFFAVDFVIGVLCLRLLN